MPIVLTPTELHALSSEGWQRLAEALEVVCPSGEVWLANVGTEALTIAGPRRPLSLREPWQELGSDPNRAAGDAPMFRYRCPINPIPKVGFYTRVVEAATVLFDLFDRESQ